MHQYKIEIYKYNSNGSPGKLYTTLYADNPEQARLICSQYENEMQVDEEGNQLGFKAYQVKLHILCYKLCTDRAAFFAQFQA